MKKLTSTTIVIYIIAFLCIFTFDLRVAKAQSNVYIIELPEDCPLPWQMQYDGSRYLWYSGVEEEAVPQMGAIVRIDTWNFKNDPSGSVTWWGVTPEYNPENSAYAGANVGVAIGGGYIWSGGVYGGPNTASDLLVRFDPNTYSYTTYWLTGVRYLRSIRSDGTYVWLAGMKIPDGETLNGTIIKFNIALGTWEFLWLGYESPYDVLLDDNAIWFTSNLGIGKINKDGTGLCHYDIPSNAVFLAKTSDGKIWYSSTSANNIASLDPVTGEVVEHDIGISVGEGEEPPDGPYGMAIDANGKLWIAGYGYPAVVEFDPSTTMLVSSTETANKPYYPVTVGNEIWCWAQGSLAINIVGGGYEYSGVLQPINADGTSIFKLGRTVPIKFQLWDANGNIVADATARLYMTKISDAIMGTEIEAESTCQATTGNLFRFDGDLYVYNLSTVDLSTGTWRLRIELDDGTSQYAIISLR